MPDQVVAAEAPAVVAPAPSPSAPPAGEIPAETPVAEKAIPPAGEKPSEADDPAKEAARRHRRQLNAAYRKEAEARAHAAVLEKQIAELKPKEAPDTGAPRLENFKDIEEYADAKAKHESDKAVKEIHSKQQAESSKRAQAQLVEEWEERAGIGEEKYPDFAEVVGDIKPTSPWSHALMAVDNGHDVAYHLGKNLKEAQEIAKLPPVQQVLRIGALSAKLAAAPPKPIAPSKAPAPITPLTGAAPVASNAPSESDDIKAWITKRQKQVHKR